MRYRTAQPDEFVYRLLGTEKISGHDCYIVESIHKTYLDDPDFKQKKKFLYSKTVSWIRQDNNVLLKADAFDQKGNAYKHFEALEVKEISGKWTIVKMEMRDILKRHKTILTLKDIKHDAGLKADSFEADRLKNM